MNEDLVVHIAYGSALGVLLLVLVTVCCKAGLLPPVREVNVTGSIARVLRVTDGYIRLMLLSFQTIKNFFTILRKCAISLAVYPRQ